MLCSKACSATQWIPKCRVHGFMTTVLSFFWGIYSSFNCVSKKITLLADFTFWDFPSEYGHSWTESLNWVAGAWPRAMLLGEIPSLNQSLGSPVPVPSQQRPHVDRDLPGRRCVPQLARGPTEPLQPVPKLHCCSGTKLTDPPLATERQRGCPGPAALPLHLGPLLRGHPLAHGCKWPQGTRRAIKWAGQHILWDIKLSLWEQSRSEQRIWPHLMAYTNEQKALSPRPQAGMNTSGCRK